MTDQDDDFFYSHAELFTPKFVDMPHVMRFSEVILSDFFFEHLNRGRFDHLTKDDWVHRSVYRGWPAMHFILRKKAGYEWHENAVKYLLSMDLTEDEWCTRPADNVKSLIELVLDLRVQMTFQEYLCPIFDKVPWHFLKTRSLDFWRHSTDYDDPYMTVAKTRIDNALFLFKTYVNDMKFAGNYDQETLEPKDRKRQLALSIVEAIPDSVWRDERYNGVTHRRHFLQQLYNFSPSVWNFWPTSLIKNVSREEMLSRGFDQSSNRRNETLLAGLLEKIFFSNPDNEYEDNPHYEEIMSHILSEIFTRKDMKRYRDVTLDLIKSPLASCDAGVKFLGELTVEDCEIELSHSNSDTTLLQHVVAENLLSHLSKRMLFSIPTDFWFSGNARTPFLNALVAPFDNFSKIPDAVFLSMDEAKWREVTNPFISNENYIKWLIADTESGKQKMQHITRVYAGHKAYDKLISFYNLLKEHKAIELYPDMQVYFQTFISALLKKPKKIVSKQPK